MSKLNNILKENYELKKELDEIISTVKENEAKHQGFKLVQYSCLLSNNLYELSENTLKYLEDIFNLDRVALFIKEGSYIATSGQKEIGSRIFIESSDAFDFTFLEKRTYSGDNTLILHKNFTFKEFGDKYSYVLSPVTDNGKITAAICIYSQDNERFNKNQDFDFIKEFSLIMSISLKKLNNSFLLEMQAQTDYLTGLPNKSMLEVSSDVWLSNFQRDSKPFAFYILDLDNFKEVNDLKGHIIGDEVLRKVSVAIRASIGDNDMLGRFGGDEFYLFADARDIDRLKKMEKDILTAIRYVGSECNPKVDLGISAGGVIFPKDKENCCTFSDILKLADDRLYKVKGTGESGFSGVTNDN